VALSFYLPFNVIPVLEYMTYLGSNVQSMGKENSSFDENQCIIP